MKRLIKLMVVLAVALPLGAAGADKKPVEPYSTTQTWPVVYDPCIPC